MPFQALHKGLVVWPDEVTANAHVECIECGHAMHVTSGYTDANGVFTPRHFGHNPGRPVAGCHGGESDPHRTMKYVAKRTLADQDSVSSVSEEKQVPGTDRIGDVVAEFTESGIPHGRGVVCEIQYKHEEKEIERVTDEYLDSGYSVYWLYEDHFSEDYRRVRLPQPVSVWPHAVPMASFWPGIELPCIHVSAMKAGKPVMDVKLPPDALKESESVQRAFELGRLQADMEIDLDVFRRLSKNNANRSCAECGDSADFYLLRHNVISEYWCFKHTKTIATTEPLS
jgi:Zn ribbon nucleic-acid-binding protein